MTVRCMLVRAVQSTATVVLGSRPSRAQALEHALRFRHGNEAIVPLLAALRAALQPLLHQYPVIVVQPHHVRDGAERNQV